MPIYRLPDEINWFPPPSEFEPTEGIVAVGGDLSTERLLTAYHRGIFPWYNPGEEILWWCPLQRMVLRPEEVKVSKSSRNLLNRGIFEFRYNTAFPEVIAQCQNISRPGQEGTWISDELRENFTALHERGYAHSAEVYSEGELVGGLYGMVIGKVFVGESMFSLRSNASKICFIQLCRYLQKQGFRLIDCQIHNTYLESLGAYEIPREEYLSILRSQL